MALSSDICRFNCSFGTGVDKRIATVLIIADMPKPSSFRRASSLSCLHEFAHHAHETTAAAATTTLALHVHLEGHLSSRGYGILLCSLLVYVALGALLV
jgi:hypothetical protein